MTTREQRMEELVTRLGALFEDYSIGLHAVRNNGGADHYRCPCCSATKETMGFAFGQEPLDSVEHYQRCDLMSLFTLYKEFKANEPVVEDDKLDESEPA